MLCPNAVEYDGLGTRLSYAPVSIHVLNLKLSLYLYDLTW